MLALSMQEINCQHGNSSALHRVAHFLYALIGFYAVAQYVSSGLVALLYFGIAELVYLWLLHTLVNGGQCGLYFFFCSGYHILLVLGQRRACTLRW